MPNDLLGASLKASLVIQDVGDPLEVLRVTGTEALSTLYRFDLTVSSKQNELDLEAIAGKAAALTLGLAGAERAVHGIVARVEQVFTTEKSAAYGLSIVPTAWLLTQRHDCRVFQGLSAPEVVEKVLTDAGLTRVRLHLVRSYAARDVCSQFREGDWDFLSRLLEDEGIHYFFEHGDDGETLVIADSEGAHAAIAGPALAYRPPSGRPSPDEGVTSFSFAEAVRPGRVTTRAVSLANPRSARVGEADLGRDRALAFHDYAERPSARDRLESLQIERSSGLGRAQTVRLVPGATFELVDHPRGSFDASYLVTRVRHEIALGGGDGPSCLIEFGCIPKEVPYRPARATRRPFIAGPQPATVVGPPGSEVHTDAQGRVLVQLHWDRTGGSEADACWVHVAQMSSGAGWGGMFIPRVGTYVLVEFLDGDPDRPIVTGRVYNEVSPHPYELPLHKTRSALRTRSTPGGDGHNELRFEDRAGAEEVYLRAQRDLALDVGHDASRTVKHDDAVTVKGGRAVKVDGDVAVTVGGSETRAIGVAQGIAVGGARTLTVAGSRNEQVGLDDTLVVLGDRKAGIGGSETHEVTGDRVATVTGSESIAVSGSRTTTVGGADTTTVGGNRSTSVHGNSQEIVEGAVSSIVSMLSVAVGGATSIVGSGEIYIEAAGDGNVKIGEPNIYLASSSKIQLRSVEEIELVVGSLSDEDDWSAKITISRSGVKIDNGDVHGSFKDSTIKLNC